MATAIKTIDFPITAKQLRALVSYDPDTGEFRWLVTRGKARAGAIAGTIGHYGYRIIRIAARDYRAARLAWLYQTGEWPADQADHRNLHRADDRWGNLRNATATQQLANTGRRRGSRWARGVSLKAGRYWIARINIAGCEHYLGCFPTHDQAASAYDGAAQEHFGQFARSA